MTVGTQHKATDCVSAALF